MTVRILLSLLAISISVGSFAQEELVPEWSKTVRSDIDAKCEAWGVDVDEEGNVYWPVNVNNNRQGLDILCYKYDAKGVELWNSPLNIGGTGTQQSYVCTVKDAAIYIGGRFCTGAIQTCDMYVMKAHKETKEEVWEQTIDFGQGGYEEVDGLEIREDGIYCGGWAHAIEPGIYYADIGLWKLDHNGNTEWINYLGKSGTAEHQDGHFVVDDQYIYCTGLWGGSGFGNLANGYSFLGIFEKDDGSLVDSILFGDQSNDINDVENALGMTTDGEYLYVTGYTTPDTLDHWQLYVAKFDKALNLIWMKDWGGPGAESARAIAVQNDIIYVAGRSSSANINLNGKEDAVLLAFHTDGELINYRVWGDEHDNVFRDIVVNDGDIYLSGASAEDLPGGNDQTAFLLQVPVDQIVSTEYIDEVSLQVYPNPSKGRIIIDMEEPKFMNYSFELFDVRGRRVLQKPIENVRTALQTPVRSGMYFYKFKNSRQVLKEGKILVIE